MMSNDEFMRTVCKLVRDEELMKWQTVLVNYVESEFFMDNGSMLRSYVEWCFYWAGKEWRR